MPSLFDAMSNSFLFLPVRKLFAAEASEQVRFEASPLSRSHLMRSLNPKLLQVQVLAICILLVSGCSMPSFRKCKSSPKYSGELLGVEDRVCHGHHKTCWRTWDEVAWSESCCPVIIEQQAEQTPIRVEAIAIPE
jgi:hypothetical protein